MSNLVPSTAKDIYQKIELFESYDPSQYFGVEQYAWIASGTINGYHAECKSILSERYDEIAGDLAAIDENDSTSLPLGPTGEDGFTMEPADLTSYLAQGLTYEKEVTHALFGQYVFDSIDMTVLNGGDDLEFKCIATVTNTDIHPYPFESMTLEITITMEYWQANLYHNGTIPSNIQILNMYRGPADNIDNRGANYYDAIDITCTSLSGMEATNYWRRVGSIWDFDTMTFEVTATFDNGATATFELYVPFTVDFNAGKITSDTPVVINDSYIDFQGSITQPAYQWSDFTKTQSPNVLRAIEAMKTGAVTPKTALYIEAIGDSINNSWDTIIDAIENGEELDKSAIITLVKSDMNGNKAIAKAKDMASVKRYGKTYFANRFFEASAAYAIGLLGISITPSVSMTVAQLKELDTALIAAGVSDFEETSGYYNWANIPNCNSKDECSRFATAMFDTIKDFDVMLEHPTLLWISNNFDYIESEMLTVKEELNKVI